MISQSRKLSFPSAYTVLMLVIIFCAIATWILPAGRYDMLRYDAATRSFVAKRANVEETLPAEQATLDRLGIRIQLASFESGSIRKPVSIPGTYHTVPANRQGFLDVLKAPILGTTEAIDVVLFVLVIGGFIGVFKNTGAFEAGINRLVTLLRGREGWLIVIVTIVISLGGTAIGMAEETIAFYPLLVPVFLAAGYDRLVPVAVIFTGTCVGTMASTTNPFATIIASNAAGVAWTSGLTSRAILWVIATAVCIVYTLRYARKAKAHPANSLAPANKAEVAPTALIQADGGNIARDGLLTGRTRLLLALFLLTFAVMIFGVTKLDWWFVEMATLFFAAALLVGVIYRPGEKAFVRHFIAGAEELLGVGLIIGLARGATIMLDRGQISDTILQHASASVQGIPGVAFIIALLFVYIGLSFFIQSSSGMAVLTMPIMSGLADVAGVPREQIINAYCWGLGLMGFVAPTGLVLPSLAMAGVSYNTWLRFVWPLVAILTAITIAFLALGVLA
ncbi:MAG: YfcC family protein [Verrucomicrobiota bacterium]|nr:YfcC family protein [Verrucomicrobiota bacterium]